MARQLTDKQKRFAENKYIVGTNGRTAARLAGYKEGAIDRAAYDNTRKPALREYALSKLRAKGISEQVLDRMAELSAQKAPKPPTHQDHLGLLRQVSEIEGWQAPKRQEKITLSGTFDAMSMAEKLQRIEALRTQLLLESEGKTVDT